MNASDGERIRSVAAGEGNATNRHGFKHEGHNDG